MNCETFYNKTSIALVMIPPGNIEKAIISIRNKIFISYKEISAKAYFNYPIILWLKAYPNTEQLKEAAKKCKQGFKIKGFTCKENKIFFELEDFEKIYTECSQVFDSIIADKDIVCGPIIDKTGIFVANNTTEAMLETASISFATDYPKGIQSKTWELASIVINWEEQNENSSFWTINNRKRSGM